MSNLSNSIYDYYLSNIGGLESKDEFHFASRLYLWRQDEGCKKLIDSLEDWFTNKGQIELCLREVAKHARSVPLGSKNASSLRLPYFKKYPDLSIYVSVLFRALFLKTIYGLDSTEKIKQVLPIDKLDNLKRKLLADHQALAILSTHAINFLYLYNGLVVGDTGSIDLKLITGLKELYDLNDKVNLQLLIYLYTHCLIGESLFYSRPVPGDRIDTYSGMLDELEGLIESNYSSINLDNKFEFLVCNRLIKRLPKLEARIFNEASQSLSDNGNFLVDRHNTNPQSKNINLSTSEHRNVLFIMANSPYNLAK